MLRFCLITCLFVMSLLLVACDRAAAEEEAVQSVPGGTEFALDLYRKIAAEHEGENIFISPFSVRSALAMTWEGARGQTAAEMAGALRLPHIDRPQVHAGFGSMTRALNAKGKPYEFNVANALWADQALPLVEAYEQRITSAYDAGISQVDFINNHEPARAKINQWVEEKTHEKIKDLMPAGTITRDTRLVLTNAVYFKGQWSKTFDAARTHHQIFTLVDGTEVLVPMMQRDDEKMGVHDAEGFSALELTYIGDDLSMVILLPSHSSDLPTLESTLTAEMVDEAIGNLREQEVGMFQMPTFMVSPAEAYRLNEPLKSMGMELALSDQADFTRLGPQEADLFISHVMHKGFVEVNEEGTEAAAATGIGVEAASEEEPLSVDRPFLFLIRHRPTGEILFLGRVLDPRER